VVSLYAIQVIPRNVGRFFLVIFADATLCAFLHFYFGTSIRGMQLHGKRSGDRRNGSGGNCASGGTSSVSGPERAIVRRDQRAIVDGARRCKELDATMMAIIAPKPTPIAFFS